MGDVVYLRCKLCSELLEDRTVPYCRWCNEEMWRRAMSLHVAARLVERADCGEVRQVNGADVATTEAGPDCRDTVEPGLVKE